MKINLILHEAHHRGIIGKMADRLASCGREQGADIAITSSPSEKAQVNHYMDFLAVNPILQTSKNTVFITHADDAAQVSQTLQMLRYVDAGICMSRMTVKMFLDAGADQSKLCYVLPAHDGLVKPRRIKIGLTTHLYPDRRKREDLLVRMGKEIGYEDFQFEIYGLRWESTAAKLRNSAAVVNIYTGEDDYQRAYAEMLKAIPEFDYYLYMGLDEGSMGTLDALAAGVPLIVTKEGFHMDLGLQPEFPFVTYEELRDAFVAIRRERSKRIDAVKALTWGEYAKRHLIIWEALCVDPPRSVIKVLGQENIKDTTIDGYVPFAGAKKRHYYFKLLQRERARAAANHYYYFLKGKAVAQSRRARRLLGILLRDGVAELLRHVRERRGARGNAS